jgi:hypothetical protein
MLAGSNADAQPYHDAWSKSSVLLAVSEIANTAKHFQLRKCDRSLKAPRTERVREGKTSFVDVYVDDRGQYFVQKKSGVPTYVIEIKGGRKFELYAFMNEVAKYWKQELRAHGIRIRRQSSSQLHGTWHPLRIRAPCAPDSQRRSAFARGASGALRAL